ncbi:O-antigen ligase [Psychrobacter sp. PL15]|uniref:O-antigen ligase family protein n=1 Tax=Psychrobacter sp. PL15 TaxID=3071719 RepID=UPI002DFA3F0F|nr:O-antigen ligase [Psychrobacter sp. PL15]
MKILNSRSIEPNTVLIVMIGLGYLFGALNTFHRYPSADDMYPDLVAIMFVSIGLAYWYAVSYVKTISLATIAWVAIFGLIAIQPYINPITYPTGLIFDLSVILTCIAISIYITNAADKIKLFNILTVIIVSVGVLTVITQIAQYLELDLPPYLLYSNYGSRRIYGNISQPNQAAFILALSTGGLLYLSSLCKNIYKSSLIVLPSFLLAIGLGLSASRTGIILMAIAILGYCLLFKLPAKIKVITASACTTLLLLGYSVGSYLLLDNNSAAVSGAARITNTALDSRWVLQQQAWLFFQENPLTGVGWGNLMKASLDHAQQLSFFYSNGHSHFFISNIAAETGIIGLLALCPFAYILVKNFDFKLSNFQAAVYTLLAIFIAYSSSEFPLWLPRYLIIFVVLLSFIDNKTFELSVKMGQMVKYVLLTFSIILALGSVFYQINYRAYSKVFYAIAEPSFSYQEKEDRLLKLSPVIGFEQFYDILFFHMMSEDINNIEYKAQLTSKVLNNTLSYNILVRSANIYLLADDKDTALALYKNACIFNYSQYCDQLAIDLSDRAAQGNDNSRWINLRFQQWRQDNANRTGLQ